MDLVLDVVSGMGWRHGQQQLIQHGDEPSWQSGCLQGLPGSGSSGDPARETRALKKNTQNIYVKKEPKLTLGPAFDAPVEKAASGTTGSMLSGAHCLRPLS